MRKRLSFANVTSVLARFLALSTGAAGAVSGSQVAPGSLTGADINLYVSK
jgi:hypothetical protein